MRKRIAKWLGLGVLFENQKATAEKLAHVEDRLNRLIDNAAETRRVCIALKAEVAVLEQRFDQMQQEETKTRRQLGDLDRG